MVFFHLILLLGNQIGDSGAKSLSDALLQNSSLQQLDLSCIFSSHSSSSGNQIGASGAKSLSDALLHNSSLQQLNLYSIFPSHSSFSRE